MFKVYVPLENHHPPCICFLEDKYKDRRVDDGMASHNWSELKCATVAERIYAALKQIL